VSRNTEETWRVLVLERNYFKISCQQCIQHWSAIAPCKVYRSCHLMDLIHQLHGKTSRYQENLVWQTKTTFGTSAVTIFEIKIEITIFLESNPDQNRDFA